MVEAEEAGRRPVGHQVGEELDKLSLAEIEIRIGRLRQEILRLEAMRTSKLGARAAADTLFKP